MDWLQLIQEIGFSRYSKERATEVIAKLDENAELSDEARSLCLGICYRGLGKVEIALSHLTNSLHSEDRRIRFFAKQQIEAITRQKMSGADQRFKSVEHGQMLITQLESLSDSFVKYQRCRAHRLAVACAELSSLCLLELRAMETGQQIELALESEIENNVRAARHIVDSEKFEVPIGIEIVAKILVEEKGA